MAHAVGASNVFFNVRVRTPVGPLPPHLATGAVQLKDLKTAKSTACPGFRAKRELRGGIPLIFPLSVGKSGVSMAFRSSRFQVRRGGSIWYSAPVFTAAFASGWRKWV